jgi:hypothetical protein
MEVHQSRIAQALGKMRSGDVMIHVSPELLGMPQLVKIAAGVMENAIKKFIV